MFILINLEKKKMKLDQFPEEEEEEEILFGFGAEDPDCYSFFFLTVFFKLNKQKIKKVNLKLAQC